MYPYAVPFMLVIPCWRFRKRHAQDDASGDAGADSLDLAKVQQVVAGVPANQVADALLAALGVHADALQIVRRGALDQVEIAAAQNAERRHRLARIGLRPAQLLGPEILVVTGDRRTVLRQDQPHAPAPD